MTNPFAGIQYSDRKQQDWYNNGDSYKDWVDFQGGSDTVFPAGTRLRMKPHTDYYISIDGGALKKYTTMTDLMNEAAKNVAAGSSVDLTSKLSVNFTSIPHLQNRATGRDTTWHDMTITTVPAILTKNTIIRIRPDYYHVVDSIDPVVKGSLDFHDIDQLAIYVDNRIRTNGLDFSVRKVKYGN